MSDDSSLEDLPPAYFLSLTLENVRCFGPGQTLDLTDDDGHPAQWTVLLGDNGTGKTTLLQVIAGMNAVAKWSDEKKMIFPDVFSEGGELWEKDYLIDVLRGREGKNEFRRSKDHGPTFSVKYFVGAKLSDENEKYARPDSFRLKVSERGKLDVEGHPASDEGGGLLCVGYGASRKMSKGAFEGEDGGGTKSLFDEEVELPNTEEWLLQTDYAAKSGKEKAREQREQIKTVLAHPDSGILPEVDDLDFVEQEGDASPPRVEFHTPYGWVTIDQISLGYRTMVAWVVDLARRLFDRYPESDNPLAEPAVCLVDEIDLHLHPKWQRKIIDFLSERFPNTQFIVTAHSPLVVQAAQDANIALLERVEVEDGDDYVTIENNPARIRNWRVDQILTSDLFDLESARPPQVDKLMREREKILAKEELTEEDEEQLDEIEEKMGDLPTGETPDDIEAMNLIRRAARRLDEES